MKRNHKIPLILVVSTFLIPQCVYSQDILFDDVSTIEPAHEWTYIADTLLAYGANVHYVSIEGWENIDNMDAIWIMGPDSNSWSSETMGSMIEFVRWNDGKIVMGEIDEFSRRVHRAGLSPVLIDLRWETTMEITDTFPWGTQATHYFSNIVPLSPITNGIDTVDLALPAVVTCGEHAFPIVYSDSTNTTAVVAISYPFLHEGNCSSWVFFMAGAEVLDSESVAIGDRFTVQFFKNILLAAAGVPGYELQPGAIPGGGNACAEEPEYSLCHRAPNPFTPNGDGINDEAEFTFPGLGEVPGTIKIFTLDNLRVRTIEVPTGSSAKEAAKWDGRDDSGAPMRPGIYLYTIRAEGRIKCDGTVTLAR